VSINFGKRDPAGLLMRRSLLQEKGNLRSAGGGKPLLPRCAADSGVSQPKPIPIPLGGPRGQPKYQGDAEEFQVDEEETPIVVLPSGEVLKAPTNMELANGWVLPVRSRVNSTI